MASQRGPVTRAFGAENRALLIEEYFSEFGEPSAQRSWIDVYRLLLWIDRTTGLAHCYESDKSQPGRHWYARSLRFHAWLASELNVQPNDVADHIDWMFRRVVEQLAAAVVAERAESAAEQRRPYEGQNFPEPGEDAELEGIILDALRPFLSGEPPPSVLRHLAQRIHAYLGQENKRKNLLGEGFEDVLAAVIARSTRADLKVIRRPRLHDIGGFYEPRHGEKPKVVDIAVLTPTGERHLVSAKWSVRADREEQFLTDYETYSRLESSNRPFRYHWFTNEFDPARLAATCDRMVGNSPLFDSVVHIAPAGVLAAYGEDLAASRRRIPDLMSSGRIISLGDWISEFDQ